MRVILIEDVANLGSIDEVVTVKDGYGRNFLIPQKKAVIASASALKILAENTKQRAHKLEKIKEDARSLAEKLEGISLVISAKTSSTGTVFGSVNNIRIAEELAKQGIAVERKQILIEEPIKEVGNYSVTVKLHKEVSIEIPIEVISEAD